MGARRRVAGVAGAILLGALSLTAPGAQAASYDGPQLVTPTLAAMLPGQQGWVSGVWTATEDVCDIKVTASAPGVTFTYPSNTSTYTSMYINNAIAKGNTDYIALHAKVAPTVTTAVPVTIQVSFVEMLPNLINKNDDLRTKKFECKGPKNTATIKASLPVKALAASAVAVVQKTTAVAVSRTAPSWARITFSANRPDVTDFKVTLTPPAGLTVGYPGEGTSSGLSAEAAVPVSGEDYVAVRLDASNLPPGKYTVPLRATWNGGSYTGALTVTVS